MPLQRESPRLTRRYDTIIVVTSNDHVLEGLASALPRHDILYCARVGTTR